MSEVNFLFLYLLLVAALLPPCPSEQGIVMGWPLGSWKSPLLGVNVAWDSGLKSRTLECVNSGPRRALCHSSFSTGHWV